MFDSALSVVISVDTNNRTIHFYADQSPNPPSHLVSTYSSQPFDEVFFQKLDRILKSYQQKTPTASLAKVSFVLPDHVFFTDTITVPSLGKKAVEHSLDLAVGAVFKNKHELNIHTYPMSRNKQTSTFGLVGVRKDLLSRLNKVCAANQVSVQNITFAANAAANGAFALNAKLRNSSFLLLDIKETSARFVFVSKGRTVGSYSLPFGHSMLYKTRLAAEDLLFNHASGELLVLNAKEKAKAKQLTMLGEEVLADEDTQDLNSMTEPIKGEEDSDLFDSESHVDSKRTGRKLPKFMLRDIPADRNGFVFENFRIFIKWTLDLIAANPDIMDQETINTVYVNLPRSFNFLYNMVNEEEQENKVRFAPLLANAIFDLSSTYARDLELFGGFHVRQYNKINNF